MVEGIFFLLTTPKRVLMLIMSTSLLDSSPPLRSCCCCGCCAACCQSTPPCGNCMTYLSQLQGKRASGFRHPGLFWGCARWCAASCFGALDVQRGIEDNTTFAYLRSPSLRSLRGILEGVSQFQIIHPQPVIAEYLRLQILLPS